MPQDTTTSGFDASLKDVYAGPIRDQLNEKTRLLDLFTKGDVEQMEWEGRQVVFSLRKSRNSGVKATAEGGLLPVAGKQGYANLKVPMRFIEGRIELTTQVMKASRSDKGSFARAMDSEQKGLVEDLTRQRNRMLAYFGVGTLANFVSTGTANFVTFSEIAFNFRVTPPLMLGALIFGTVIGFIGSLLPSIRAARFRIVDALRAA